MIINSPTDEEVQYSVEKITKDTIIVAERSVNQKEFPILSQQKLKETSSAAQYTYVNVGGTNNLVKYSGNSSCKYLCYSYAIVNNHLLFVDNNIVASIVQQRQQQPTSQADGGKLDQLYDSNRILQNLQTERLDNSTIVVNNLNGLSLAQHMNDLSIYANGATEAAPGVSLNTLNTELLKEKVIRSADIVSHTDTILDLAQVEYKTPNGSLPMLISSSRDCTVKIWK